MPDKNLHIERSFGILLLDMSAAFNLSCRSILVPKLELFGLTDCAADLIDSYLTDKKNMTKVESVPTLTIVTSPYIVSSSVVTSVCVVSMTNTVDTGHATVRSVHIALVTCDGKNTGSCLVIG